MSSSQRAQEKVEKEAVKEKEKGRGVVKSVLSGDTIVVLEVDKSNNQGPPPERQVTFSSLTAPRLGRPKTESQEATKDEPYSWESREFLRKKSIGKKVVFTIDYVNPTTGREYGTVYLVESNECLNHLMISEGWATVFKSSTGKEPKRPDFANLLQLEDAAMQDQKGMHNKDPTAAEASVRPVLSYDPFQLYNQLKGKELQAVVEQVRTGSTLRVTLLPSFHNLVVMLSGVQAPMFKRKDDGTQEAEPFARESKFFVEQHVLQRDVQLTLEGVDKMGNFFGSISYQGHDVAEELLKAGLAHFVQWSASARGPAWGPRLANAFKLAKEHKRRLYANYVEKGEAQAPQGLPKEFTGRVAGVVNAGTLAVLPDVTGTSEVQVTLSSIRVPKAGYPGDEADEAKMSKEERDEVRAEKAYAAEAKEYLRKKLIGQKVRVVLDYVRAASAAPGTTGGNRGAGAAEDRAYYTVYSNDHNIAVNLVDQGLARVMQYRAGEDRTQDYEALVMAENNAKEKNKGLYGPTSKAPVRHINDLCVEFTDSKARQQQIAKARQFLPFLQRGGTQKAVVEYVFSGSRYKLYVPKETCVVFFSLSGVKVPKRGENAENDELSNAALAFARERLHQRDVTVDVQQIDKGGNFLGQLYYHKKDFAIQLLEQGYATVQHGIVERLAQGNDYIKAEEQAKAAKKNIWKNYDEEAEKRRLQEEAEAEARQQQNEYMDVIVTEIIDGAHFYMQIVGSEAAALDELVAHLTELSASENGVAGPEFRPRVGDLVRSQFTEDDSWYRAKIMEASQSRQQYTVQYIDYGNREVVPAERIRPLPAVFQTLPPQATEAGLAFVKAPKLDSDFGREAAVMLRELTVGKKLVAEVIYRDNGIPYLGLGHPESSIHVNAAIVRAGLARVDRRHRRFSHPLFVHLREEEDKAKAAHVNIWQYGDAPDSDEDEDDVPRRGQARAQQQKGKDQPQKGKSQPQQADKKKGK
jgi:staphylococcal nuclease domain-containing protein 1